MHETKNNGFREKCRKTVMNFVTLDGVLAETSRLKIEPVPLKTERALQAAEVHPEQYEEFMAIAENPEFTGHIVHALASDPEAQEHSGKVLIGAEIAQHYGIKDEGREPPSYREMLGAPPEFSEAKVY